MRQGPLRLGLRRLPQRLTVPLIRVEAVLPEEPPVGRGARRRRRQTTTAAAAATADARAAAAGRRGRDGRPQAGRAGRLRRGAAGLPRSDLGRGARPRRPAAAEIPRGGPGAIAGFGSAKCSIEEAYVFQKLIRAGVRHQQRRPLHAAVPRVERRRAVRGHRLRRGVHHLRRRRQRRRRDHHRLQPDGEPPGRRSFFKQARRSGTKIIYVDPRADTVAEHADYFCRSSPAPTSPSTTR